MLYCTGTVLVVVGAVHKGLVQSVHVLLTVCVCLRHWHSCCARMCMRKTEVGRIWFLRVTSKTIGAKHEISENSGDASTGISRRRRNPGFREKQEQN